VLAFSNSRAKRISHQPSNDRYAYGQVALCLPPLNNFLLSEIQTFDNVSVSLDIILFDVVEKSSSLADQLKQTTARMMIFFVRFEMLR
jgi:hypothetical protein